MKKTAILLSLLLCLMLALCACSGNRNTSVDTENNKSVTDFDDFDDVDDVIDDIIDDDSYMENEIEATIILTNGETIEIELYPELAPKTVANFVKNVQEGFYSGTIFHRVIKGFMIQGGGYDENLNRKDVSETVEGEFESNGFKNNLKHTRGVISMARTQMPNSASTQFFIMHQDAPHLDGEYAAFGRVVSGMEVVDEIADSPINHDNPNGLTDVPEKIYTIDSIIIDTDD